MIPIIVEFTVIGLVAAGAFKLYQYGMEKNTVTCTGCERKLFKSQAIVYKSGNFCKDCNTLKTAQKLAELDS